VVVAPSEVQAVAAQAESRLASSAWQIPPRDEPPPEVVAAGEVAAFALKLSGRRRQASLGGRFRRLITHFALAACLALASVAAACDKPDATEAETAEAIRTLPTASASNAEITQPARASPARYEDLVLVDAGSDQQPWAVLLPRSGGDTPILADRVGSDLTEVGSVYRLPSAPVAVGTRDGPSQFLDPLAGATPTGEADVSTEQSQVVERWREDQRYLATTRAIAGQPTVLDAAYNAQAAVDAGGTHTYLDGVVLRVDPDNPVLSVIDRALLESGQPTRPEDVVPVAIRSGERSLYEPGQVVNLRDVAMSKEQTDVEGQSQTMYIANAALDGARVEPTGRVDLPALLGQRLSRVDSDLAAQTQEAGVAATPAATPQATAGTAPVQQQVIVDRGGSHIDDFLIWMWIANSGFFRGPNVIVNNPPGSPTRGGETYYSPTQRSPGSTPSTVASSQAESRNTALQAARSSVSGQASGTGGGVAATNKAAADATSRASAATTKAAAVAAGVSAASAGKSISSVPKTTSSTASRSAGSVSAGSRGGTTSSGSSGSSSSSSGSKGIGGSSGGFGGSGATSGGSS
jgi:hypothetical protein